MKPQIAIAGILALTLACKPSPMGTNANWETVKQFAPGTTTILEVVEKIGPATLISPMPNDGLKFRWTYMIPRGYKAVEVQTVELTFDSNKKLIDTPGNKKIVQMLYRNK